MVDLVEGLNASATQKKVSNLINAGYPGLVARFGSTELRAARRYFLRTTQGAGARLIGFLSEGRFPFFSKWENRKIGYDSGFYPIDESSIGRFAHLLRDSMCDVDLLGSWVPGEAYFGESLKRSAVTELGHLSPLHAEKPWTWSLEGRRVLVIHPFARTIEDQYTHAREKLFPGMGILPRFELDTLRAVQTLGGPDPRFATWFDALEWMRTEALERTFDVAIISCGAYGFPLAAMLKKEGRLAIHLGGEVQILFGIKGSRWDQIPTLRKLYNPYWVRPRADEVPPHALKLGQGSYW